MGKQTKFGKTKGYWVNQNVISVVSQTKSAIKTTATVKTNKGIEATKVEIPTLSSVRKN